MTNWVHYMSSWTRIMNLPKPLYLKILDIYKAPISIEVRKTLSHWIDEHSWETPNIERLELRNTPQELFDELCAIIEEKMLSSWGLADRWRLIGAFDTLKIHYTHNPAAFIRLLRKCILEEREILESFENSILQTVDPLSSKSVVVFLRDCTLLKNDGTSLKMHLLQMSKLYKSMTSHIRQSRENQRQLEHAIAANLPDRVVEELNLTLEFLNARLEDKREKLEHGYENFIECLHKRFEMLAELLRRFSTEYVAVWGINHQPVAVHRTAKNNLRMLQRCFDRFQVLPKLYITLLNYMDIFLRGSPGLSPLLLSWKLPMLSQGVELVMIELMSKSFFVEKQPEAVLIGGGVVTCQVRYLFGQNAPHDILHEVEGYIVSDGDFDLSFDSEHGVNISPRKGRLKIKSLDVTIDKGSVASFEIELLDYAKRKSDGQPYALRVPQKYRLMFETTVVLFDREITLRTASSNFVVTSADGDAAFAEAMVLWENLHSDTSEEGFGVEDTISWPEMAEALSIKFHAETQMFLSERQLQYLGSEALRQPNSESIREGKLTFSQFCEEPLPGRDFTFWEWFIGGIRVTGDHLQRFAAAGVFLGFIELHDALQIIFNEQAGSFLLRISESYKASISIVGVDGVLGKRVAVTQTLRHEDLTRCRLSDRLRSSKNLLYFYPDIPKFSVIPEENQPWRKQIIHQSQRKRRRVDNC